MDNSKCLLILISLLCVIGVILADIERRDVHRIVIKGKRRARSHHHHHHNRGSRGYKRPYHRNSAESHESYRNKNEPHGSFEENASRDVSFEEIPRQKYHHKTTKNRPLLEFDNNESKVETFHDDWTPLISAESTIRHPPPKYSKNHRRPIGKFHDVELTTSFPHKYLPTFYDSSDFASVSPEFSNNFHHKAIRLNKQSPLVKHVKVLPAKSNNYEVHEDSKDRFQKPAQTSFDVLGPSLDLHGGEASNVKEVVVKPEDEKKTTKSGVRGRGRAAVKKNP